MSRKNTLLVSLYLGLLSVATSTQAQKLNELLQGKTNLEDIMQTAEIYFENKQLQDKSKLYDDNEYTRYKRTEWYWQQRVNPDGTMPNMAKQHEIYSNLQRSVGAGKKTRNATWRNISQKTSLSGYEGMGRAAAIAFHPTDTNTFYVGVNKGGIWKTSDGAQTWTPLGDQLPFCSVGSIVIDPVNPDLIYITIGLNEGWWHYGLGVYKSTDGGLTWQPTSQVSQFTDQIVYYKLMRSPDSNLVLYSAQSDGLWKTSDGAQTWTKIRNGVHRDIEFKPFHANTLYVAGGTDVFKSTDAGATWTAITNLGGTNNIEISVTPADSNYIALGLADKRFFLSTDGGNSPFVLRNSNIDDNDVIQISHLNKDRVYCGFVSNHRSTNGGSNWTKITNWYNDGVLPTVHADNRYADVSPLQPHYIYFCNDGGLYRLNELNNTWKDLSDGLIITEFYKIALSAQDSTFMIGGTQDNGGRKRVTPTTWAATNGGDGMEVAIKNDNDNTIYTTYWGGTLYRSYDKWTNNVYHEITPDTAKGSWVTPYMLMPDNNLEVIAGYADVWFSYDEGDAWIKLSNNLTGNYNNKLQMLDVAPSDRNYIYTGRNNTIYYTKDFGANWTTRNVPSNNGIFENCSMIKVHPKKKDVIFVTKSGYANGRKVYLSLNNGDNFQNVSHNLPNVPVNCIQIDAESDSTNMDIYVGTDVGVFYKKEADTVWQYYGSGLPNTHVSDIEIFYPTGKLRAATYGRGIWETRLVRHVAPLSNTDQLTPIAEINLLQNPVASSLQLSLRNVQPGIYTLNLYDQAGRKVESRTIQVHSADYIISHEISHLPTGIYISELESVHLPSKWTGKLLKQ